MKYSIAPATIDDTADIYKLFSSVYGIHRMGDEFRCLEIREAAKDGRALVCRDAETHELLGAMMRNVVAPEVLGCGTFVLVPAVRSHGIGTEMFERFTEQVRGRWKCSLILTSDSYATIDPTKRSAVNFYSRAGCTSLGQVGLATLFRCDHP